MTGPWRGPGSERPDVPLPPGRMPWLRGGRPLKRWTWVGAFGPDVMLCAGTAAIGPAVLSWWGVWDRSVLAERTVRRRLPVTAARVAVPEVMDLTVEPAGPAVEVVSPH